MSILLDEIGYDSAINANNEPPFNIQLGEPKPPHETQLPKYIYQTEIFHPEIPCDSLVVNLENVISKSEYCIMIPEKTHDTFIKNSIHLFILNEENTPKFSESFSILIHNNKTNRYAKYKDKYNLVFLIGSQEYMKIDETSAYCGKQGYIRWDLENKKGEYIPFTKEASEVKHDLFRSYIFTDLHVFDNPVEVSDVNICDVEHANIIKNICKDKNIDPVPFIRFHRTNGNKPRVKKNIKLLTLAWSNVYCYGENNYINFDFNNNLVMINGNNKQGKSSVIDILIRILFNENIRGNKDDILRKDRTSGFIQARISCGDEYIIEQSYTKKSVAYSLLKNGESVEFESIIKMYKYLRDELGLSYHNVINTNIALQNRTSIVDMPYKDFINMLTHIVNVNELASVEEATRYEINTLKNMNRKLKETLKKLPEIDEIDLIKLSEQFQNTNKKRDETQGTINKVNKYLNDLNRDYINIVVPDDLNEIISKQKVLAENDVRGDLSSLEYERSNLREIKPVNKPLGIEGISSSDLDEIPALENECYIPPANIEMEKEQYFREVINRGFYNEFIPIENCEIEEPVQFTFTKKRIKRFDENIQERINELLLHIDINLEFFTGELVKPRYYDNLDKYKAYLEKGLPDYKSLQTELFCLNKYINLYELVNSAKYNESCKTCTENKQQFSREDISAAISRRDKIKEILAKKEKTIKDHSVVEERLREIEQYQQNYKLFKNTQMKRELSKLEHLNRDKEYYLYYKKQNEILQKNIEAKKINEERRRINQEYNYAKDQLREIDNKKKWDRLCLLKAAREYFQYRDAEKRIRELDKIIEVLTAKTHLSKNLELQKIHEKNQELSKDINKFNKILENAQREYKSWDEKSSNIMQEYIKKKTEFKERENITKDIQKNNDRLEFLETYFACVNTNTGIPHIAVKKLCNTIEEKANIMLNKLADFKINIMDKIYTIENDLVIPAAMASGYQKFLLDLIIRVILTMMADNSAKMLFIDEGFGALDPENLEKVIEVIKHITNRYDFVCVISHISVLKNTADKLININHVDDSPNIQYGEVDIRRITIGGKQKKETLREKSPEDKTPNEESSRKEISPEKSRENDSLDVDKKIRQYIEENGGVEKVLLQIIDDYIFCKACNKNFSAKKKNIVNSHLRAESYKKKHNTYLKSLLK